MRLHAYVLAGDPAWIGASIRSYYHLVDRIVVSFDRSGRSWSGAPMSIDQSLALIAAADPDGKTVLLPGDHVEPERYALLSETAQRQGALDAASEGADWVLQLDTDEIVPAPHVFARAVRTADERAASALAYPARNFYARTGSGAFLEHCGRFWTTQSGYPGPVVVRAGTTLSLARQARDVPVHRVDVSPWNTDPAHPRGTPVHAVIRPSHALIHMSWVRTEEQMIEKSIVSGHSSERNWTRELDQWRARARHPWVTAAQAPFARNSSRRFRVSRLPPFADADV
jgi:hypothetical protein